MCKLKTDVVAIICTSIEFKSLQKNLLNLRLNSDWDIWLYIIQNEIQKNNYKNKKYWAQHREWDKRF